MYLYLRSNFQLYDQFYLYAKKIKKVTQVSSPTKKHVISSPRVLSRFSPVASLVKRTNSCKRFPTAFREEAKERDRERDREEPRTSLPAEQKLRKSTFTNSKVDCGFSSFATASMLSPKKRSFAL